MKYVRNVLLIVALAVFLFAAYHLCQGLLEYHRGNSFYEDTAKRYVTEVSPEISGEPAASEEDGGADESSDNQGGAPENSFDENGVPPTVSQGEAAPETGSVAEAEADPSSGTEALETTGERITQEVLPVRVDFQTLQRDSREAVAWLYCAGTPINYPVAQSGDNSYYLNHLLNGTVNSNGTLFLDYRCNSDFSGAKNIIFGHHMRNGSMFGTLTKYKEQSYFNKHPVMWLTTPVQNYRIDLLAGVVTDNDSDIYTLYEQEDLAAFLTDVRQQSTFTSSFSMDDVSKILLLSTCSYEYNNARYVLIGSMVEAG